jgi:hypothetical protein
MKCKNCLCEQDCLDIADCGEYGQFLVHLDDDGDMQKWVLKCPYCGCSKPEQEEK